MMQSMRMGRPFVFAALGVLVAGAWAAPTPDKSRGSWLINGAPVPPVQAGAEPHSVARIWMDQLIEAIRHDFARPTVHARNLFHVSVAMWDAWAVYSVNAYPYLSAEHHSPANLDAARNESISFAAYRVIQARFANAPGAAFIQASINAQMDALGYNRKYYGTLGNSPAAIGNRIAINVLSFGLADNSNEQGGYGNLYYAPINPPLLPDQPGNPQDLNPIDGVPDYVLDPNRWQPLALQFFVDQAGNIIPGGYPAALSPEWGQVTPFALADKKPTIYQRDGFDYWVYHDPGPPPLIGGAGEDYYKWGIVLNAMWSSHHTTADGVMQDISPASIGNAPTPGVNDFEAYYDLEFGGDWGPGYPVNPATGQPYTPQVVPRGDYTRCLTQFWSDGTASETPPGHWFTILNYVSDHPLTVKKLGGQGSTLPALEWDVKCYLALGGAVHDTAVTIWGIKGWYDYVRPISALRYMAQLGQSSDPKAPSYHPQGIPLYPGHLEVVTAETTAPGERHEHLFGNEGKIALYAWRGPPYIPNPQVDVAGVAWILAENWWPFFPASFVTPPFPGYPSGHSGFSRSGAIMMSLLTGSDYFPGGLGEFFLPANQFLFVEEGPSVDVTLQWARYKDASDQCSLSRLWGGIHPPCDDIPSRIIGEQTGPDAYNLAQYYFQGTGYVPCPSDVDGNSGTGMSDLLAVLAAWGSNPGGPPDVDGNGNVGIEDLVEVLDNWGPCPS